MKMKLNLKQQKVNLDLSSRTILTKDHSKLLNIEAHVSGHTGFVYDEDFVAYQEEAKTTADNLQTQIDNLDVGYITEEEMQQHLAEQATIDKAQDDALNTEVADRKAADTTLQNNIDTNTTLINEFNLNTQKSLSRLGTQLDKETSNRKSADSALDARLSSAETGLTTETANRIKDDDTLHDLIEAKQDKLVSGSNIKTINGEPIVGAGNISIGGGSSAEGLFELVGKDISEFAIVLTNTTYLITSKTYNKIYVAENYGPEVYGSALVSTVSIQSSDRGVAINGVKYALPRGKATLLTQGKMNVYKMREE